MKENMAAPVTTEQVKSAARLVSLPLSEHEAGDLAVLLGQWIPAAAALDIRMQSAELDEMVPITAFTMPGQPSFTTHTTNGTIS